MNTTSDTAVNTAQPTSTEEFAKVDTTQQTSTEQLTKLGEEYRKASEKLEQNVIRLKACQKQSVAEVVACGTILIRAKELCKHGEWLPWLKEHQISSSTAERQMKVASKSSHLAVVTNLNSKNVTHVYRALGLLPTPKTNSNSTETTPFLQVKGYAVKICNLLNSTDDPDKILVISQMKQLAE